MMQASSAVEQSLPVSPGQRILILDALRGFALLGICLANFPEFSLFTFLKSPDAAALPGAGADRLLRFLHYALIDGKFYTIFSLLFGIGFSIILAHARSRRAGLGIFYRRMTVLLGIGFLHLMFLWSGDILMLYALIGMTLPLFRTMSERRLLLVAASLLLAPVAVDAVCETTGWNPSAPVVGLQKRYCRDFGITDANFAYWLRDAGNYAEVLKFLVQGAFERIGEFIDGNRVFKVAGLFLLGYCIGNNRLYARLGECRGHLRRVALLGASVGLPISVLYAWSATHFHPWGLTIHSLLTAFGILPLALAAMAAMALGMLRYGNGVLFRALAAPGRMALTCYLGQSVAGVFLFYGIGLGLGAGLSLFHVTLIALAVYLAEVLLCGLWLRFFAYGPLEWGWRMLAYGRLLPLRNDRQRRSSTALPVVPGSSLSNH